MNILQYLCCPLCKEPLTSTDKTLHCRDGHCFDISKEGYVNLLPPGKGKNARTGDEKEMLRARRAFLAGGYYAPISDTIAALLHKHLPDGDTVLCDSGCGEGWHTLRITEQLAQRGRMVLGIGFDASKHGAAYGMKSAKQKNMCCNFQSSDDGQVFFLPANIFVLPLQDTCISAVISMFAPVAVEENLRVLKNDGFLVTASSGKDHLRELRELLYTDVHYADKEPQYTGFSLIESVSCKYVIDIPDKDTLWNLFTMTPFYYRTTEQGRQRLREKDCLSVTVDTELRIYTPDGRDVL